MNTFRYQSSSQTLEETHFEELIGTPKTTTIFWESWCSSYIGTDRNLLFETFRTGGGLALIVSATLILAGPFCLITNVHHPRASINFTSLTAGVFRTRCSCIAWGSISFRNRSSRSPWENLRDSRRRRQACMHSPLYRNHNKYLKNVLRVRWCRQNKSSSLSSPFVSTYLSFFSFFHPCFLWQSQPLAFVSCFFFQSDLLFSFLKQGNDNCKCQSRFISDVNKCF
jgi:hypothetical protein